MNKEKHIIHVKCHVAPREKLDPWNPIHRFMMTVKSNGESISEKTATILVNAICGAIVNSLRATGCSRSPLGTIILVPNESTRDIICVTDNKIVFVPDNEVWMTGYVRHEDNVAEFVTQVNDRIRPTIYLEDRRVAELISQYLFSVYDIIAVGSGRRHCMIGTSEDTKLGDAYVATDGERLCGVAIDFAPRLVDELTRPKQTITGEGNVK